MALLSFGDSIQGYTVGDPVGRSALGELYRVDGGGVPLVLEALDPVLGLGPADGARLSRAATRAARVTSQRVVTSLSAGVDGRTGLAFVVHEGPAGVPLSRHLSMAAERVAMALSVVEAVATAHLAGLTHDGVRPEAFRVVDDEARLFGTGVVAFALRHRPGIATQLKAEAWLAPDLLGDVPAAETPPFDPRADLRGAALVVAWILSSGQPLTPAFPASANAVPSLSARLEQAGEAPRPELDAWLSQCFTDGAFADAEAALQALRRALGTPSRGVAGPRRPSQAPTTQMAAVPSQRPTHPLNATMPLAAYRPPSSTIPGPLPGAEHAPAAPETERLPAAGNPAATVAAATVASPPENRPPGSFNASAPTGPVWTPAHPQPDASGPPETRTVGGPSGGNVAYYFMIAAVGFAGFVGIGLVILGAVAYGLLVPVSRSSGPVVVKPPPPPPPAATPSPSPAPSPPAPAAPPRRHRIRSGAMVTEAPPVLPTTPTLGPPTARVIVHIYSDFQCPFCKRTLPAVMRLRTDYPSDVRLAWHDHPLAHHKNARPAALAAREAFAQKGNRGFWRFHDVLFSNQRALSRDDLLRYARLQRLDVERVTTAIDDDTHGQLIDADAKFAKTLGMVGVPSFVVGREVLVGAQPYVRFKAAVERALKEP